MWGWLSARLTCVRRWWTGRQPLTLWEFRRRAFVSRQIAKGGAWGEVLRQDVCAYCNKPGGTFDHITPKSKGGTLAWTNVAGVCQSCNLDKGDRSILWLLMARRRGAFQLKRIPKYKPKAKPRQQRSRPEARPVFEGEMKRLLEVALAAQARGEMGPQRLRKRAGKNPGR